MADNFGYLSEKGQVCKALLKKRLKIARGCEDARMRKYGTSNIHATREVNKIIIVERTGRNVHKKKKQKNKNKKNKKQKKQKTKKTKTKTKTKKTKQTNKQKKLEREIT